MTTCHILVFAGVGVGLGWNLSVPISEAVGQKLEFWEQEKMEVQCTWGEGVFAQIFLLTKLMNCKIDL